MSSGLGYRIAKRTLDLAVSLTSLILLSPVLLLVALLVRLKLGSPILFRQERAGLDGKPFYIIKFRTMTSERDNSGNLLPNEQRRHPFGDALRSFSLDELPQFFNILFGEMSLVGPRPLHLRYGLHYSTYQKARLSVIPGVTGLAQVRGRNSLKWRHKFLYDQFYVSNQKISLDLKIIRETVFIIIKRSGVNNHNGEIVEDFNGNN